MPRTSDTSLANLAAVISLAAASLLAGLCSIVLVTGASQQRFERFAPPADYASALLLQPTPFRLLVAVDDVFIVAYVAASVLLCAYLSQRASKLVLSVVLSAAVLGGMLDLIENHHMLAMLSQAEYGLLPSVWEIDAQMVASSIKWMLGHAAFALLAFALEVPGRLGYVVRTSLLAVQLPLGVATLVVTHPDWLSVLIWLRYGSLVGGFVAIAMLIRWTSARA